MTKQTVSADLVPVELSEEAAEHLRLLSNPYVPGGKRPISKMTPAKKRKFCEAIANGASPSRAAKALGVARSTVYYQAEVDPDFKAAWAEAQERDADRYEEALEHLATTTRNVGAVIFSLKNKRPDKWQDRQEVHTRSESVTVHVTAQLSEDTKAKIWEIAHRASQQKALPSPDATPINAEQGEDER